MIALLLSLASQMVAQSDLQISFAEQAAKCQVSLKPESRGEMGFYVVLQEKYGSMTLWLGLDDFRRDCMKTWAKAHNIQVIEFWA